MSLSNIITFFQTLFSEAPAETGLILDDAEQLAALPQHDLVFGASVGSGITHDWTPECPPFRYQGSSYWCTAFAGCNAKSALLKRKGKEPSVFSPLELFYRSYGTVYGNRVSNTLAAMQYALVLEADKKTPVPDAWGYVPYEKYKSEASVNQGILDEGKVYAIKASANVLPTRQKIREALAVSPVVITVGIGRGYYLNPAPAPWSYSAYHALLAVNVESDGRIKVFDSLEDHQGFNGFHYLSANYPILTAASVIDLSDNWQDVQKAAQSAEFPLNAAYFGRQRNTAAEQAAVALLVPVSKRHPEIAGLLGRYWIPCVNAIAYGSYSLQDILNQMFSLHRGMKPPFDLNALRVK